MVSMEFRRYGIPTDFLLLYFRPSVGFNMKFCRISHNSVECSGIWCMEFQLSLLVRGKGGKRGKFSPLLFLTLVFLPVLFFLFYSSVYYTSINYSSIIQPSPLSPPEFSRLLCRIPTSIIPLLSLPYIILFYIIPSLFISLSVITYLYYHPHYLSLY